MSWIIKVKTVENATANQILPTGLEVSEVKQPSVKKTVILESCFALDSQSEVVK